MDTPDGYIRVETREPGFMSTRSVLSWLSFFHGLYERSYLPVVAYRNTREKNPVHAAFLMNLSR